MLEHGFTLSDAKKGKFKAGLIDLIAIQRKKQEEAAGWEFVEKGTDDFVVLPSHTIMPFPGDGQLSVDEWTEL